ncbi:MAG: glycosyltransferase [Candidatus Peribacteria bacterium]|jgi:glycosyltransferase involved in cell wall biosynthesis|nr:glycosyltransferase [Candidatus Peribacteria bacterium]
MIGLLYYGRLEKEKGFDAVIKLIAILPQTEFFIF